ncbi:hypothetical protein A2U01_0077740, partial [Trifolium medium]|nr:hypothetical protein [Trifolium medium]
DDELRCVFRRVDISATPTLFLMQWRKVAAAENRYIDRELMMRWLLSF